MAKDINEENPPELSKGGFSGVTLAYNAKSETEVDDILHSVKKVGAQVVKEPQTLSWGGYGGYFIDPEVITGKLRTAQTGNLMTQTC